MVWRCGTAMAAGFGVEVHGLNTSCLRWMRSTAARLSPGGGDGSLQSAILALHPKNDPGGKAFVATVIRYCEEVWTPTDQTLQTARSLTAGGLFSAVKGNTSRQHGESSKDGEPSQP